MMEDLGSTQPVTGVVSHDVWNEILQLLATDVLRRILADVESVNHTNVQ
jgi:hypothetical protein